MERRLYRQGDIILEEIETLPREVNFKGFELSLVGETGNAHVLPGKVYVSTRTRTGLPLQEFIEVGEESSLMVHPEHPPLAVSKGIFSVRRLRTYTPDRPRDVVD